MSSKSHTFVPSYLKQPARSYSEVAKRVTTEVRKTGSYAPPPYQSVASMAPGMALERARTGQGGIYKSQPVKEKGAPAEAAPRAAETVAVELNLTQVVALVSACLAAADHALVVAARWETCSDTVRAQQHYARSVMLESTAEQLARASRQTKG
jgi:hypothetical protein